MVAPTQGFFNLWGASTHQVVGELSRRISRLVVLSRFPRSSELEPASPPGDGSTQVFLERLAGRKGSERASQEDTGARDINTIRINLRLSDEDLRREVYKIQF